MQCRLGNYLAGHWRSVRPSPGTRWEVDLLVTDSTTVDPDEAARRNEQQIGSFRVCRSGCIRAIFSQNEDGPTLFERWSILEQGHLRGSAWSCQVLMGLRGGACYPERERQISTTLPVEAMIAAPRSGRFTDVDDPD